MPGVKISFPVKQFDKDFAKLWLGFVAGIFLIGIFVSEFSNLGLVYCALMFTLGLYYFYKTVWNLAEEVLDCGDYLRVKKSDKYQDIYFKDIEKIYHPFANHKHLITIKTRRARLVVTFRALKGISWGWSSPSILKELQRRIR